MFVLRCLFWLIVARLALTLWVEYRATKYRFPSASLAPFSGARFWRIKYVWDVFCWLFVWW